MQSNAIIEVLSRALPGDAARVEPVESRDGMPTIYVPLDILAGTAVVLRDAPELRFAFLADVTAVDYYPRQPRFEVVYVLVSPGISRLWRLAQASAHEGPRARRTRQCRRSRASGSRPTGPSAKCTISSGSQFDGHPDLRRILMPDDWEGFPLRKDYPVQIKDPVKTYSPLQVSEEEFVANMEAARDPRRRRGEAGCASTGAGSRGVRIVARTLEAAIARTSGCGTWIWRRVAAAGEALKIALTAGSKVLVFGNGGSAADAQHLAAELVGRFQKDRPGFAAVALTADTSLLTSARERLRLRARVRAPDRSARPRRATSPSAISTSGAVANVVAALNGRGDRGLRTIALTGRDGGALAACGDSHQRAGDSPPPECRKSTSR